MTTTTTIDNKTSIGAHGPTAEIGLDADHRTRIGEALSNALADTFTLYLKSHNYHWNVTGPRFPELHAFFEEQYNELWEAVDMLAERVRSLGLRAPGTMQEYLALTTITEPNNSPGAEDMVSDLARDHERILTTLRKVFQTADAAGDEGTADMMVERMRAHEKTAWMLRSTI